MSQPLLDEGLLALRERGRALAAAWLGAVVAGLAAVAVPWYLRALELELGPLVWSVFAYAAFHLLAVSAAERVKSRSGLHLSLAAVGAASLAFLALLWHMAGVLDNPVFLLTFFLPAVASGVLLGRGAALLTAALSVAAVVSVASLESAELRWYLIQLGVPIDGIVGLLPQGLPGGSTPFPGLATGPAFQLTLLLAFAILLPAAAVLAERAARQRLRVLTGQRTAAAAREEARDLFQEALRADPVPTLLLNPDTGQLLDASRSFVNQMLLEPGDFARRTLFDVLSFSDPESVRELLRKRSGELAFCGYRVGKEARMARLRAFRVELRGEPYACVRLVDQNELFYLSKALDALDEALLVIREGREVAYYNEAAERLFPGLHFGIDAAPLLESPGQPPDWWSAAGDGEHETRAELAGVPYDVRRVAARPAGAHQDLTLLRLRPGAAA